MAGGTVIGDAQVIENRWSECTARRMAGTAITCRRDMVGLGDLASGIGTIVAGVTTHALHLWAVMVDKATDKGGGVMTHGAITAGNNVIGNRVLARNPREVTAVAGVTTYAQYVRPAMVNVLRRPGCGVMTH